MMLLNSLTGLRFTADELEAQYKQNQAELSTAKPYALHARVDGLNRLRGKYEALRHWERDEAYANRWITDRGFSPERALTLKLQLLVDLSLSTGYDEDEHYRRGVQDVVQSLNYELSRVSDSLYKEEA